MFEMQYKATRILHGRLSTENKSTLVPSIGDAQKLLNFWRRNGMRQRVRYQMVAMLPLPEEKILALMNPSLKRTEGGITHYHA
ncbi:MAG: hypothetical protein GY774_22545 [Planctomycetes bacterium]|nr:hypothetical protein [Planctomycetota bacterium]|tara:strand:+ start:548 stop:796 length:249 start_codon:yes stop_codon:yes gene_type:complete